MHSSEPFPGIAIVPASPARLPDLLFEAVADQTIPAWRQGLTSAARGALNAAVRELRGIGATPAEIVSLVQAYRSDMPGCTLTPSALAKHAPRLRGQDVARWPKGHDAILRALDTPLP